MQWQNPVTRKLFVGEDRELIKLKHRNATSAMSQVVHIPAHVMKTLRPKRPLCHRRVNILFHRTKAVDIPEDMANYLLNTFPNVIFRVEPVVFHYDKMKWNDLQKLAIELNVYRVGMNKDKLVKAIKEVRNDNS